MYDLLSHGAAELVRPDYKIYSYTEQIYKIVKFKSTAPSGYKSDKENHLSYDQKLDSSLSRSRRVVLELALCNDWKYFCTFTIAKENYDRKDLSLWHKDFSQWLRDQRKKCLKLGIDIDIQYVLVPEQHKDGSWHMHGLFSDITPLLVSFYKLDKYGYDVPYHLVDDGYYCWFDYWVKFGYCSLAPIKDLVSCGFYITKYISKSMQKDCVDVGLHLYYPSRGLKRSSLHGDIFGQCSILDKYLVNDYDFCKTGMTAVKDGCTWNFAFEYMDHELIDAFRIPDEKEFCPVADSFYDCTQEIMEGFPV